MRAYKQQCETKESAKEKREQITVSLRRRNKEEVLLNKRRQGKLATVDSKENEFSEFKEIGLLFSKTFEVSKTFEDSNIISNALEKLNRIYQKCENNDLFVE